MSWSVLGSTCCNTADIIWGQELKHNMKNGWSHSRHYANKHQEQGGASWDPKNSWRVLQHVQVTAVGTGSVWWFWQESVNSRKPGYPLLKELIRQHFWIPQVMPDPLLEALCLAAWSQPVSLICCQDSVAPPCHWRTQKNYPTLANTSRSCGLLCLESPQLPDKTLLTVIGFFSSCFWSKKSEQHPPMSKRGKWHLRAEEVRRGWRLWWMAARKRGFMLLRSCQKKKILTALQPTTVPLALYLEISMSQGAEGHVWQPQLPCT